MGDLLPWEIAAICVLFVWSGFVRSGIGFGGAVLSLPFLLMIREEPLLWLPIISVHLLFFSAITVWQAHRSAPAEGGGQATVNWAFLKYALLLMIVPKLIGVAGVITLPGTIMSGFIFVLVTVYGVSYVLNRPLRFASRRLDAFFMMVGGYISGASLIAAPLVVPIAAGRVPREQLRDTLFVLWFILVGLKLIAFVITGVDLQWKSHLWLLPCATVGHLLGLRFHRYTLNADTQVFFRVLGGALILVSLAGLLRLLLPAS
jgi:uncharacterized membrane protein YfcA